MGRYDIKNDLRVCKNEDCKKQYLTHKWRKQDYCSKKCVYSDPNKKKPETTVTLKDYVRKYGIEDGSEKYNLRRKLEREKSDKKRTKYTAVTKINGKSVRSKEYNSFACMKARCNNPKNPFYKYYGGRGIKVLYLNFTEFLDDVGFAPSPTHSIDRKDNSGNYEKGNCKWATKKEQLNNTRINVKVEHNGVNMTLQEVASLTGMSYQRVQQLIKKGKTVDYIMLNCNPRKK